MKARRNPSSDVDHTDASREEEASAYLSFSPLVGTLSVTFGTSPATDQDFLGEDLVAVFDSTELGRLLTLQGLFILDQAEGWRRFLFACLGPTVADRCQELINEPTLISRERIPIAVDEWKALRQWVWPMLHGPARVWLGRNPLAEGRVPTLDSGAPLPIRACPLYLIPPADHSATVTFRLPARVAETFGLDPTCELILTAKSLRLGLRSLTSTGPALETRVVEPRMARARAVPIPTRQGSVSAEIPLHAEELGFPPARVLLVLGQSAVGARLAVAAASTRGPRPPTGEAGSKGPSNGNGSGNVIKIVFAFFDLDADRPQHGMRGQLAGAIVRYSGVEVGRTADRVFWKGAGRSPIEVVVLRQGTTLWARGFVKKSRLARTIEISCTLNPEPQRVLRPRGAEGTEAPALIAQGSVDKSGFFQVRLAEVEAEEVEGELVATIELRLRRTD